MSLGSVSVQHCPGATMQGRTLFFFHVHTHLVLQICIACARVCQNRRCCPLNRLAGHFASLLLVSCELIILNGICVEWNLQNWCQSRQ